MWGEGTDVVTQTGALGDRKYLARGHTGGKKKKVSFERAGDIIEGACEEEGKEKRPSTGGLQASGENSSR